MQPSLSVRLWVAPPVLRKVKMMELRRPSLRPQGQALTLRPPQVRFAHIRVLLMVLGLGVLGSCALPRSCSLGACQNPLIAQLSIRIVSRTSGQRVLGPVRAGEVAVTPSSELVHSAHTPASTPPHSSSSVSHPPSLPSASFTLKPWQPSFRRHTGQGCSHPLPCGLPPVLFPPDTSEGARSSLTGVLWQQAAGLGVGRRGECCSQGLISASIRLFWCLLASALWAKQVLGGLLGAGPGQGGFCWEPAAGLATEAFWIRLSELSFRLCPRSSPGPCRTGGQGPVWLSTTTAAHSRLDLGLCSLRIEACAW